MNGRTHAFTGIATSLALAAATGSLDTTPIAAHALAGAAALLPDLDQHSSLALRLRVTRPLWYVLRHLRHRQLTHSLAAVAVFALLWGALLDAVAGATGVGASPGMWLLPVAGYASHIAADMFNKRGCGLFAPVVGRDHPLEWIAIPVPERFRISTIADAPKGLPVTLGRLQARINTEKLFFRYPVYGLIGYVAWHHAEAIIAAARSDVLFMVQTAPAPAAALITAELRCAPRSSSTSGGCSASASTVRRSATSSTRTSCRRRSPSAWPTAASSSRTRSPWSRTATPGAPPWSSCSRLRTAAARATPSAPSR